MDAEKLKQVNTRVGAVERTVEEKCGYGAEETEEITLLEDAPSDEDYDRDHSDEEDILLPDQGPPHDLQYALVAYQVDSLRLYKNESGMSGIMMVDKFIRIKKPRFHGDWIPKSDDEDDESFLKTYEFYADKGNTRRTVDLIAVTAAGGLFICKEVVVVGLLIGALALATGGMYSESLVVAPPTLFDHRAQKCLRIAKWCGKAACGLVLAAVVIRQVSR